MGEANWPALPPISTEASLNTERTDDHWRHLDNSVNAVSFGFVATAILISMFLIMAIFERFLRQRSPPPGPRSRRRDLEAAHQSRLSAKLEDPRPKILVHAREASVLMPGQEVPTFIALPAPAPCPPKRLSWPLHQQFDPDPSSSSNLS